MRPTPCEKLVWYGLPIIRKSIAESMINDYNLNQRETAENLCISNAAISQYVSGKRVKTTINDMEMKEQIRISAELIIQQGDKILVSEICRLCKLLSSKRLFSFL